jgi:magnesium transporter
MTRRFCEKNVRWIDLLDPAHEELQAVASEHGIHEAFVADAMQPEHLPKYEPLENTAFFILRHMIPADNGVDTIQGLTNKIAIFQKDDLVVTIHKYEAEFLLDLKTNLTDPGLCRDTFHLLNRVIKAVLQTFEPPALRLAEEIDNFEAKTFLKKNPPNLLKGLYHVKRKIEVSKRLLILSKDILERIDSPEHRNPDTRDTRDLYIRMVNLYDSMSDNTNHLLTLYFSISSQRTNEVIRVLTLFSVFFMPLTFIVGIYGMNFKWMPELTWKAGYPAIVAVMIVITVCIYLWFRKKGWL